jgi:ATP-dependent helicase/nuclease subunit A
MPFTKNQLEAIKYTGKNVLVSASAGSGKTGVLKERVIEKLKNGINIDELVVLTFTEAAALEMKSRIIKEIHAQNLTEQIPYIDNAIISTFDAFTLRLVREYHYLLGVDNKIGIADDVIIQKRRKEIIEAVVKRQYVRNQSDFRELFKKYFNRSDQWLYDTIDKISHQITKQPDYQEIINHYEAYYLTDVQKQEMLNEYVLSLKSEIGYHYQIFVKDWLDKVYSFTGDYQEYIYQINAKVFDLINDKDIDSFIIKLKNLKFPRKPNNKELDKPDIINEIKDISGEINSLYAEDSKDLIFGLDTTVTSVKTLMKIIKEFIDDFETCKRQEGLYSFEDIMYLAIKLFKKFPDVKNKFRRKIKEILVDEYQDTNDLQDSFIQLIADDNIFMVGDVKQSIYRFRDANPKNFMRIYDEYQDGENGKAIFLQENFRSNRFVLESINKIFAKIMTRRTGGVDYQGEQVLITGYDDNHGFHNQDSLNLLLYNIEDYCDQGLEKVEIEANLIARDIKRRISEKEIIVDSRNKEKVLDYSDMTILVSQKGDFNKFQKIFASHNIPLEIYDDQPFFESDEIKFVFQLLLLIYSVNDQEYFAKYFSTAFYAVARSFVYQISDKVIIKLLTEQEFKSIDDFAKIRDVYELKGIYDDICYIRDNYSEKPVFELLEAVYQRINIYRMVAYLKNPVSGEQKLDYFSLKVRELEGFSFYDLICYLETIIEDDAIDLQYNEEKRSVNAVKLMSMHKSKGLQFPVVYLAQMYKQFFFDENKDQFVYSKKYGLLTKAYDEGFYPTFVQKMLFKEIANETYSERIRLLYVAMTRAINKLVVCLDYDERLLERTPKIRSFKDLLYATMDIEKYNTSKLEITSSSDENKNKIPIGKGIERRKLNLKTETKTNKKFSKDINYLLDDETIYFLKNGTRYHQLLETIDFNDWENSIESFPALLKEAIMYLVNTDLFMRLENPRFLKEYEFLEEDSYGMRRGIIDLLIIDDKQIIAIDYKLKNLDDEAYFKQLKGYYDYLKPKFEKKVRLFLYSLTDKALKEIKL